MMTLSFLMVAHTTFKTFNNFTLSDYLFILFKKTPHLYFSYTNLILPKVFSSYCLLHVYNTYPAYTLTFT